jgi:hypothetical protein
MIPLDTLYQIATMLAPRELMRLSRCSRALRALLAPLVPAARDASVTKLLRGVHFIYSCQCSQRNVVYIGLRSPQIRGCSIDAHGTLVIDLWYSADRDMLDCATRCANELLHGDDGTRMRFIGARCLVGNRSLPNRRCVPCHVWLDEPPTRFPRIPRALCAEANKMLRLFPQALEDAPKWWCAVM